MIDLESHPGRLRMRTRTASRAQLLPLALAPVALAGILGWLSSRQGLLVELRCDRRARECVRTVDGRQRRSASLDALERAEARAFRSGRGKGEYGVALVGPGGMAVISGLSLEEARRDAAALDAFLSGAGPDVIQLRWDRRLSSLFPLVLLLLASVIPLVLAARSTVCILDRVGRTVSAGAWRRRARRLGDFAAVAVETGREHLEAEASRHRERTGREPRVDPRRASALVASRRIALVTAEGERFPLTAWLPEREELEPAADRVRAVAGLP